MPPRWQSEEDRFRSQVASWGSPGCWNWLGQTADLRGGYGRFARENRSYVGAHRYAYELMVGPIPEGLSLDHTCNNPRCVKPTHLEPVTRTENNFRRDKRTKETV